MARVVLVGESWTIHSTHVKGFDSFTTSEYGEGGQDWMDALTAAGHQVDYLPAHKVPTEFPRTVEAFQQWDVVVLSDIGANSLEVTLEVWKGGRTPNPLDALEQWVLAGGGLAMCGGYLSFAGFEAKARFAGTAAERALPVHISKSDDRVENPTRNQPVCSAAVHPIATAVDGSWPSIVGYNRVVAKADATVLAMVGDDPFIVVGQHGAGRSLAFVTDIGPHWAPVEFVGSEAYRSFWPAAINWLAGDL